jgi:purine-binding chemotaxis protein CheW
MSELYVVFSVASAEYAVPAALVAQLETFQGLTPVPGTARHVAGIVQVRGRVLPLVDLRPLFGHPAIEPTPDSRVVVVEQGARRIGLLVDRGREVLRLAANQIQVTPELVEQNSRGFFAGVVQLDARLIMLLDIRKVVGEETLDDESARRLQSQLAEQPALPGGVAGQLAGSDGGVAPER